MTHHRREIRRTLVCSLRDSRTNVVNEQAQVELILDTNHDTLTFRPVNRPEVTGCTLPVSWLTTALSEPSWYGETGVQTVRTGPAPSVEVYFPDYPLATDFTVALWLADLVELLADGGYHVAVVLHKPHSHRRAA